MSRRASCAARSAPTPHSEVTGLRSADVASSRQAGFFSGEILFSGGDIGRTITAKNFSFNGKEVRDYFRGAPASRGFNSASCRIAAVDERVLLVEGKGGQCPPSVSGATPETARGTRALPQKISHAPNSSAFWNLPVLRRHAGRQISIATISGRQLKRTGMGYQPMPELTLSGPALV